jgi:hypothetical protein
LLPFGHAKLLQQTASTVSGIWQLQEAERKRKETMLGERGSSWEMIWWPYMPPCSQRILLFEQHVHATMPDETNWLTLNNRIQV